MVRRPRAAAAFATAGVAFVACGAACVDDNIPLRPVVVPESVDGGPLPVQLASNSGCGSIRLAVAGGTLFWTEKGTNSVKSVPTTGGPTTVIAASQSFPGAIAVDETSVFWVGGGGKTVLRKPLAGGPAVGLVMATTVPEVFGGENDINVLLVDNGTLYFGRYTNVFKVPTSGGSPKVIGASPLEDRGKPAAFAIDATHLYQTELDHAAVSRETLDGTQMGLLEDGITKGTFAPDRIAVSQGSLLDDAIAVLDGKVFWANGTSIESKAVDDLEHTNSVSVTTSVGSNTITGFVISNGVIYFGEIVDNTIEMAPLATGVATVIARGQLTPRQFAADADNIYWRTGDCRIMKLAK
jgi:hypothetical protein